ncbi:LacI family DNA-binding transcriptional regulator [Flavisolibacter ginsenosidimutans]|uniref:LacI family transcriptional regulator n=1 Tax=Flavisolibacter ginsenosidimutans TaxID=661481 RepID=A0A5B8UDK7_9BACT|nr:LacI family DNA-binding transcriptional regulator [Flavisolibacter ginsenosidimutans]QEC54425.1 LacI family transcriptional regulator [Flavisolibacter ginsenosidimutans]
MDNKLPTIKEIAKRLNVSVSTVSRALSDHPRIGLRTKTQVQQLAKELGYEPNAKAISFKQQKSFVVGVVLPFIREEFFSQAISGIEAAAMESNYTILFGQSYDDVEREKSVVNAMRKQRVDGLLISLSKETNQYEHLRQLEKYNIPVVYFDRVPPFEKANKVFCNLYKGTVEMINWLLSRGYKRIALINGPDKLSASKERLNGYIEGHSRRKLKVDMQLVEKTDLSKEGTYAAMKSLLSQKNRPQAIITFNEYVHMDAVQYAAQQNILVNKEIVFASYANLPITNYTAHPPLVSVEQYPYGQGEKAMEIMIRLLNGKATDAHENEAVHKEEIPATLVLHQAAVY